MKNKYFIITIDTEGDNVWNYKPQRNGILIPETQNAKCLERFQKLCEKHRFYPTYLTDYEMAKTPVFVEFGREVLRRGSGEIGMHMHAFSTPPFYELSDLRGKGLAFAGEYPYKILHQKMEYMTKTLQDTFQTQILSHRGGRWYLDKRILRMLDKLQYIADCTVTPGIDWSNTNGQTKVSRGVDYRKYLSKAYNLRGTSLWELPVTIKDRVKMKIVDQRKIALQKQKVWLRPDGKNLKDLIWLVDQKKCSPDSYLEFMLHSSELMSGANPTFKTQEDMENLYSQMDELFAYIRGKGYKGITCSDYVRKVLHRYNKYRY